MKKYVLKNLTFLNRLSDSQLSAYKEYLLNKKEQKEKEEEQEKQISSKSNKRVCTFDIIVWLVYLMSLVFPIFMEQGNLLPNGFDISLYYAITTLVAIPLSVLGSLAISLLTEKSFPESGFEVPMPDNRSIFSSYYEHYIEKEEFFRQFESSGKETSLEARVEYSWEDNWASLYLSYHEGEGNCTKDYEYCLPIENIVESDHKNSYPTFDMATGVLTLPTVVKQAMFEWLEMDEDLYKDEDLD